MAARHAIETAEAIPFSVLLANVKGFARQRAAIPRSLHKQGRMRHAPIDRFASYPPLTPAARITGPHLRISLWMNAV